MNILINRMIRAARLDAKLYEEVEADKTALTQSILVVILSSLAAGVGSIVQAGFFGIITGTIAALIGWLIWSYLAYIIGTKLLPVPETRADYGELLRTIGFSSSPGLIRILGIIPFLFKLTFIIAAIWAFIAMVIAVRQALDYKSTFRAVGVCIIGWIIQMIVLAIFFSVVR